MSPSLASQSSSAVAQSTIRPGKLKEKQSHKHPARSGAQNTLAFDYTSYGSSTPLNSTDSEAQPSRKPRVRHNRSISKESYLKNLQKRFRDKDDDTSTVDLSLSMDENEKRSGLAISSHTQTPELTRDVDDQLGRAHRHNHSLSSTSFADSDTYFGNAFTGFAQPSTIESRPHSPLVNRHSYTELEWKFSPDAVDPKTIGLGIDPGTEPRQRAATFDAANESQAPVSGTASATWHAATASAPVTLTRPKIRTKASNSSSIKPSRNASQSTLASIKGGLVRRATAQSQDNAAAMSPLSRSSTDPAFGFRRGFSGGSKAATPLTEADRQAAIDAARTEFRQKQEAKTKKYDEQQRRVSEKKERKNARQQERVHRKSDLSARPRPGTLRRDKNRAAKGDVTSDGFDAVSTPTPPRQRKSSLDDVKFEYTLRTPNLHPKKEKRASSGFVTWCKAHVLHLRA